MIPQITAIKPDGSQSPKVKWGRMLSVRSNSSFDSSDERQVTKSSPLLIADKDTSSYPCDRIMTVENRDDPISEQDVNLATDLVFVCRNSKSKSDDRLPNISQKESKELGEQRVFVRHRLPRSTTVNTHEYNSQHPKINRFYCGRAIDQVASLTILPSIAHFPANFEFRFS